MALSSRAILLINEDPYVIRACVKAGEPCVLIHGPGLSESGYVQIPDEVETVFTESVTSVESLLAALTRAGLREREFSCVMTSDEEALVAAAVLGTVLRVPAMAPDVALLFRDKWLQKQAIARAGIPVAQSTVIEDVHAVDPTVADAFAAAVLKPIASGGTQFTSVVRGRDDLIDAATTLRSSDTAMRTFVLEEFIDGAEWVANGVVADGVVRFTGIGVYAVNCLAAVNARSEVQVETLDPVADAKAYARVLPVVERCISALGLQAGVFHMELFVPDNGPVVFSECAARRGGGMTHEVIQEKFGIDLGAAAVACALGREADFAVTLNPQMVGSTSLLSPPGLLVLCPTVAELQARPGVRHAQISAPRGSSVGIDSTGTFQRTGQVLLSEATPLKFRESRDAVVSWFDERVVVVPFNASPAELRTWQAQHWPDTVDSFLPFTGSETGSPS